MDSDSPDVEDVLDAELLSLPADSSTGLSFKGLAGVLGAPAACACSKDALYQWFNPRDQDQDA
jgi:hypothetical protein